MQLGVVLSSRMWHGDKLLTLNSSFCLLIILAPCERPRKRKAPGKSLGER